MGKKRLAQASVFSGTALAALVLVLWPDDALAWGPLAHLSFTRAALSDLTMFAPALRALVTNFTPELLYGSLAADIIVGKNLAPYATHCHNWSVGFKVMERARTDAQRAFSMGFLAHLAADTVAHNYFVPYKNVQAFAYRRSNHAYWELRYDQQLPADLWKLARQVSRKQFREHDKHLEECLSESYVIPFSISKKLFGGMLLAAQLKRWQKMSAVVTGAACDLQLEEVRECEKLAVQQIIDVLRDGQSARCVEADPTGGRNLHLAQSLSRTLRSRADLHPKQLGEIVRGARPAFRDGIHGRIRLPEVPDELAA